VTGASVEVLVVGGGPAGATISTRLAQLGHDVLLVDRGPWGRRRMVESLPPDTLELLARSEADRRVKAAGFTPFDSLHVVWEGAAERRARPGGLLVDRPRFDALLLEQADEAGVEVWRPASATAWNRDGAGWSAQVATHTGRDQMVRARFMVDASGRPASPRNRVQTGARTFAVSARWVGMTLDAPAVVACERCWLWASPSVAADDGRPTAEVVVFVDPALWRSLPGSTPAARYVDLVRSSGLDGLGAASPEGGVTVADATPSHRTDVISDHHLMVGDAAVALDPLSSTGVQKAIQGALAGAVVVHTVLTRPSQTAVAVAHYRQLVTTTAAHHAQWAAESYAMVAAVRSHPFWAVRASGVEPPVWPAARPEHVDPQCVVRVSPRAEFVNARRLSDAHVTTGLALAHPALEGPTAYLGGVEIVPLLASLTTPATLADVALSWAPTVTLPTALRLAGWLHRRGVLEEVGVA
jgi:flavin-dependent dehydrogenase